MPYRDPLHWLKAMEDPPRNGRAELVFVIDPSLSEQLVQRTLFIDQNYARPEVETKRTQNSETYYLASGPHRLLVRGTLQGTQEPVDSNVLFVLAQENGRLEVKLTYANNALLLQGAA